MVGRTVRLAASTALVGLLVCFAPSQVVNSDRDAADATWNMRDWERAITAYEGVLQGSPSDGRSWFRYGFALHNEQRYRDAIAAYEKAISFKYGILNSYYNTACAYARLGRKRECLEFLEKAIASGYTVTGQIQNDVELTLVKEDSKFIELLARSENPVAHHEEGRKASGLFGAWESTDASGVEGIFTANASAKGYSRSLELVSDGSRVLHLYLYFRGDESEWRVRGTDRDGTAYTGGVRFEGSNVVCIGTRESGQESRAVISTREGVVRTETFSEGQWSPSRRYSLKRIEVPDGGR